MKFDRKAPGCGLEIITQIQGGKAYLEGRLHLCGEGETALSLPLQEGAYLNIRIWDREERLVFSCQYPLGQEEPMKGIILHPKLWQGTENPYLYRIQASLMEHKDCAADILERKLALRSFCEIPIKGWFLNEYPFEIRAVEYEMFTVVCDSLLQQRIRSELELIKELGANVVCPIGDISKEEVYKICDELGLIILSKDQAGRELQKEKWPRFCGVENSLFTPEKNSPTDLYYYYKACWSKEPFVYISTDSFTLAPNKSAKVVVYSNQKKVALYVEGALFEFRTEGPDYIFEEIPVKQFPVLLTAETGECSMSVAVYPIHKTFT